MMKQINFNLNLVIFLSLNILCLGSDLKASIFVSDEFINKQVWFWELVFDRYESSSVIIHDVNHPDIVIDIIDFKILPEAKGKYINFATKQSITNKYLTRYQQGIQRIADKGNEAARFGKIEQRLLEVYAKNNKAYSDLLSGKIVIRSQTGLADNFKIGLERAANYLPYMERIFIRAGLPRELTRLPFVESMFNSKALSKVGAFGMWQFMPATAKQFMRVDDYIDERRSPLKSTQSAAQLMISNYNLLKSWPLAITAYNHGAGGLARAKRNLNTDRLSIIIQNHKDPNFGFASKNFYAEFLAANKVFAKYYNPVKFDNRQNPLDIEAIYVGQKFNLQEIVQHTPLDLKTIRSYNKCLLDSGINYYNSNKLPKNYVLFIPRNSAAQVRSSLNQYAQSRNVARGNQYAQTEKKVYCSDPNSDLCK